MTAGTSPRVVVAGGAGFLGSRIAARYVELGCDVTVVDGLLSCTGGRETNLASVRDAIRFIRERIEDIPDLGAVLRTADIVVDCMAWTSHQAAMKDPLYDLRLNAESHLHLIQQLPRGGTQKVIYLGSRSQFGNPAVSEIDETTHAIPEDVQGIHKLTAEHYWRVYAKQYGLRVISLRLPNCFGEHQPIAGDDIGLVGNVVRDLLQGKTVQVFGDGRRRGFVFADDAADIVCRLSRVDHEGYLALNFGGWSLSIEELVRLLVEIVGTGSYERAPVPAHVQRTDMGNAHMSSQALEALLGELPVTDLRDALSTTAAYFRRALGDTF